MAEKELRTRMVQKHDTEENWLKALNFVPKQGEIIVYDVDASHAFERMKIGDGVNKVNDLPFSQSNEIITMSQEEFDTMSSELLAQFYVEGIRLIIVEFEEQIPDDSEPIIINQIKYSIDYNGNVYDEDGWKTKTRIKSTGEAIDADYAAATGFIKVKAGDIIYITAPNNMWIAFSTNTASNLIAYYKDDESKTWLGSTTSQPASYGICTQNDAPTGTNLDGGVSTAVVPNNSEIGWMRVSVNTYNHTLENMIITVNQQL